MTRARPSTLRLECLEDRSVPATFNVTTTADVVDPADGKRSLREAINAANTLPGADVIVVPAGVYNLTGGDLDITSAVMIAGAGASATVVNGQQLDRVFDIAGTSPNSIKVVIQGLTVRNGNTATVGAGILVGNADLVVRDCTVTGNRSSGNGAGIASAALFGTDNVKVVRSLVSRNVSGGFGGGISGNIVLTVKDSTVRRNIAAEGGGGIATNTATLTNSTVSNNSAGGFGGGINSSTATLTNSTVSGNSAGERGGGISVITATLTNSTVDGNNAGSEGGGIRANTATLTNSTVSGNSAGSNGGGIYAEVATLLQCTIVENIAAIGGGVYHDPGGAFAVKNTIIALNLTGLLGADPDASGFFLSGGHNLIGYGTAGGGWADGVNGDMIGPIGDPLDPKLGPLANNGGRTKTHALLSGSRAIDRGDNASVPATDQRGQPRRKDGNGDGRAIVDIGAFER